MGLFKKVKEILFDEEEYTEQIKITPEMRNEETPIKEKKHKVVEEERPEPVIRREEIREERPKAREEAPTPTSERELFKTSANFPFFDFDEEEFSSHNPSPKPVEEEKPVLPTRSQNAYEFERKRKMEKRSEFGRYEKAEKVETIERKKFRPSPIISPVYGILDRDYDPSDIVHRRESEKVDIQTVRNKAFGDTKEIPKIKEEPKKTYYEEEETVTITRPDEKEKKVKTIDELLEDTSDVVVDIDRDLELPKHAEPEHIYEAPTRESRKEAEPVDNDKTLENDLFDLIDSMYDSKEDGDL